MSGDCIPVYKLEVIVQSNGIMRDPFGAIMGRCDDDWLDRMTNPHFGRNIDGLPVGMTISDDGDLLNWRGENYVRQGGGAE